MGKQTKSRKSETLGKGKVSPVQIAVLVDRYLADNSYTNTRSSFRNEASDLISRSPVNEAPSRMLSLGEIIDEYVSLKGQKVVLDEEKRCLEDEKLRVQNLLSGMQNVLNGYNAGVAAAPPLPPPVVVNSGALVPHANIAAAAAAAAASSGFPVYHKSVVMSASKQTSANPGNLSTPMTYASTSKRRKGSKDGPNTTKRSRSQSATKHLQANYSYTTPPLSNISNTTLPNSTVNASSRVDIPSRSQIQGSSVAKCLFNQHSQSLPMHSSGPITPPRVTFTPTEKSGSSPEVTNAPCSNDVTPQPMMSNCTVMASETITVSPAKQKGYYSIERNCRISTSSPLKTNTRRCFSMRDNVKGRLDFDGPSTTMDSDKAVPSEVMTSQTEKGVDSFDFDLPNLDVFGEDFCFNDLLGEFEINCGGMNYTCQPDVTPSPDSLSGSANTSDDTINGCNQFVSELSSTMTEIISEQNMNTPGPESVTSVKSITKSITILSPVKNQRSPSQNQKKLSPTN